jgi:hypothetical protein
LDHGQAFAIRAGAFLKALGSTSYIQQLSDGGLRQFQQAWAKLARLFK